jgi:putative flippase GtrA
MGGNPLHKLITTLRTQFFDAKLIKFVIVGVVNTLVGMAIMFGLYNLAGCSYWVSSAANYILTSILSYFLNKTFTFGNKDGVGSTALRFALNIAVCYLLAYGIAKPAVNWLLSGASVSLRDNCSMLTGMVLFTGFNYIGQRFFAFRESE